MPNGTGKTVYVLQASKHFTWAKRKLVTHWIVGIYESKTSAEKAITKVAKSGPVNLSYNVSYDVVPKELQ